MNPGRRAVFGAAAGALLVLLAHPLTRPGLMAAFRPLPRGGLPALLARPRLVKPTTVVSGAAYLHAGAERLMRGSGLRPAERSTLIDICNEGAQKEPENAFWPVSKFVFRGGEGSEAMQAWRAASKCSVYNDYQSRTLEADRDRLAATVGGIQGWIYAAVAPQRSDAMARLVVDVAARALKGQRSIEFAYETIRNGAMIRDGSRRLALGTYGIALIEGATYPPEVAVKPTPHRLWIAKTELTASLRRSGRNMEALFCDRQFRINDSWQAFGQVEDPNTRFQTLSIAAALVDALPGALLATSIVGGLIWLFGLRVTSVAHVRNVFKGPGLTACSLSLLVIAAFLGYPVVGLTAGICALVPALSPDHPRKFDDLPLGPFHAFMVGSMAITLLLCFGLAAIARSLPGQILPQQGPVGAWLGDTPRLLAIAIVALGASALIAPAWAIVRRFSTPAIAAVTYRGLGRRTAVTGLVLAILLSPVSLAIDRLLGDHLGKIALNEQVYYNPSDTEGQ